SVLPADSSQLEVVARAANGESIVVEGPPGTGKSQTIANTMAELALAGKSVLFVAEKRSAVDVVLNRLDDIGLSDLALDLHGPTPIDLRPHHPTSRTASNHEPEVCFPLSESHHEHLAPLLEMAGAALQLRGDRLPRISLGDARLVLGQLAEVKRTLEHIVDHQSRLSDAGFAIGFDELLALVTLASDLDALRRLADLPQARRQTLRATLAEAAAHHRLLDLRPALDSSFPIAQAIRDPNRAIGATFTQPTIRARLAGSVAHLLASLRATRLPTSVRTLGHLLAVGEPFVQAGPVGPELLETLESVLLTNSPVLDATCEQARAPLGRLADAIAAITDSPDGMAGLRRFDEPDRLITHPTPGLALDATLARVILTEGTFRTADELDREAQDARTKLENARRNRAATLLEQTQHPSSDGQSAIDLEGLVRRSRGRRTEAGLLTRSRLDAILVRYPVLVMNPWAVAQLLPQTAERFDTVIFDEASQLEPAAAIPALARARSAVIFGDSYQLPPNTFFRSASEPIDDLVLAQASLLDAFATLLAQTDKSLMLRWHYRSEDDRLIDFVARSPRFYGGRLVASTAPPGADYPILFTRADRDLVTATVAAFAQIENPTSVAIVTFGV
ncbi:MAG: hypothetical protein GY704_02210, partial [Phycisphaeraceae bacterium]|nr:hypothetical protein [Phycisphaeraceae bacterium]